MVGSQVLDQTYCLYCSEHPHMFIDFPYFCTCLLTLYISKAVWLHTIIISEGTSNNFYPLSPLVCTCAEIRSEDAGQSITECRLNWTTVEIGMRPEWACRWTPRGQQPHPGQSPKGSRAPEESGTAAPWGQLVSCRQRAAGVGRGGQLNCRGHWSSVPWTGTRYVTPKRGVRLVAERGRTHFRNTYPHKSWEPKSFCLAYAYKF